MTTIPFNTPVLFLIFNRPDTTRKVFDIIRKIRPRQLFVSADGPHQNKTGEEEKCAESRKIIEEIDWDCELKTNYSEKNLGCRLGVSSGINWFFSNVQEGIILEDDCLPDTSYYRNNERIMHIGGINFQDGRIRGSGSYYFSKLNHIWGWATWKRAWEKYDVDISLYPQLLKENKLSSLFPEPAMKQYWQRNLDLVCKKQKDTWDIQWQFAMSTNNGLAIYPNVNLISNIGFDLDATHTVDDFHPLANRKTGCIDTIIHPVLIEPDIRADSYSFRKYINPNKIIKSWRLIRRILA
jgi:hypothetical protein